MGTCCDSGMIRSVALGRRAASILPVRNGAMVSLPPHIKSVGMVTCSNWPLKSFCTIASPAILTGSAPRNFLRPNSVANIKLMANGNLS